MKMFVVVSAVLLLLFQSPSARCEKHGVCPGNNPQQSAGATTGFTVLVKNRLQNLPSNTYQAAVAPYGILISALNRLMYTQQFHFTYILDPNYGPYLQSVNRVSASLQDRTYWELLSKNPGGDFTSLTVGIGCYQPQQHEIILLNFTTY